ncbi:hypothetical protein EWM64_g6143 [Hericium alpestre]|uniref:AMP-dependent synthetase/ligase domain-containing protein n=1 Tax=Hericium alpestre TaxID=135208 RepID=A0A4Y9ZSK2_9AGAM|nr:hypothetical protein EWM64_g6143 [Hericium alpestre]
MLDLSILRTRQGMNSSTWQAPPLDGSLTLPEIFEYHSRHSPEHPLFVYPNDLQEPQYILYPEVYRGMRKAAKLVSTHYQHVQQKYDPDGGDDAPIVGILATAGTHRVEKSVTELTKCGLPDSITYFTLMMGIMLLGFTPFPISTRNSAAGVAHLVRTTGVLRLFVSPDPAMQRLSKETIGILAEDSIAVKLIPIPQFEDFYNGSNEDERVSFNKLRNDKLALILHSSGEHSYNEPHS